MTIKKLKIEDIIEKHTAKPAVVCLHGPSLNSHKETIANLQASGKLIRFSVNNWYHHFETAPDYWVISNSEYAIPKVLGIMNEHKAPIFYSKEGDNSTDEYIQQNLQCDYLPYDQRHFKGHDCITILKAFKKHHTENNNFDFKDYGNNNVMWHPPRTGGPEGWAGFDPYMRCCDRRDTTTIQEELQRLSAAEKHYSTGDTVAFHAIAFAIMMGCNPIYVTGLDLNYSHGYSNEKKEIPMGHYTMWQDNSENLLSDMEILNESAKLRQIRIINLNKESWHDVFAKGDVDEELVCNTG